MPVAHPSRGKMSAPFAGICFGLLFLLFSYLGFRAPAKDQSTVNTVLTSLFLGIGILVLVVSGIYFRRRAKRLGILDAMNKD